MYGGTGKQAHFLSRTGSYSTHGNRSTLESVNSAPGAAEDDGATSGLLDRLAESRKALNRAKERYREKKKKKNRGQYMSTSIADQALSVAWSKVESAKADVADVLAILNQRGIEVGALWSRSNPTARESVIRGKRREKLKKRLRQYVGSDGRLHWKDGMDPASWARLSRIEKHSILKREARKGVSWLKDPEST